MILPHYSALFEKWAPFAARFMLAVSFLFSAVGKIPGSDSFTLEVELSAGAGLPFASLMVTLAFIVEIVCSGMLIVGYHVRTAAFLLASFVFLISLTFVRDLNDHVQMTIFFSCMNLIAGLLYVAVYGAKTLAVQPD